MLLSKLAVALHKSQGVPLVIQMNVRSQAEGLQEVGRLSINPSALPKQTSALCCL